jgi:tRNA(Ile)-lysidine synthase TilS/MesJ
MTCKKCKEKPVIKLTNSRITLCKKCFIDYFEKKVKKTIRNYKLFKKGETIGIALSGGKDSLTTLHIVNNIAKQQRTTKVIAITIDEGIKGYRDKTLTFAKKYCKENDIDLHIASYKETFGKTLDSIVKKTDTIPCSICGVFRRYLLNFKAKELKIDKLATGHNLDDEAQTILMNQFRNNLTVSARLGPITGLSENKKFIRRIKPLYFVTEKEVMTYAFLNNLSTDFSECPYA